MFARKLLAGMCLIGLLTIGSAANAGGLGSQDEPVQTPPDVVDEPADIPAEVSGAF